MAEGLLGKLLDQFSVPGLTLLAGLVVGVALTFAFADQRIEFSKTKDDWSVTIRPATDVIRISAEEAAALGASIADLSPDQPLSVELLQLRDEQRGPFTPVDKDVVVRFDESPTMPAELAVACGNSAFFGRKIAIFKLMLDGADALPDQGNRQRDFLVITEAPLGRCGGNDGNVVWVSAALKPQLLGEDMSGALAEIKGLARVLGPALQRKTI